MTLSASATLVLAIALNSCNNAEEVKKQVEAQNAAIQTAVDEKLNALQEQVNTECTTKIDSLANVAFAAYQEEAAKLAKSGKKPTVKPKPKPKPVEPKKDEVVPGKKGETLPEGFTPGKKGETAPTGFVPGKKK